MVGSGGDSEEARGAAVVRPIEGSFERRSKVAVTSVATFTRKLVTLV